MAGLAVAPERTHDELAGLADALAELSPNQQRAILMREWQGLSYREIAAQLDLTEGAVETLLFRARRSLARKLDRSRGRTWAPSGRSGPGRSRSSPVPPRRSPRPPRSSPGSRSPRLPCGTSSAQGRVTRRSRRRLCCSARSYAHPIRAHPPSHAPGPRRRRAPPAKRAMSGGQSPGPVRRGRLRLDRSLPARLRPRPPGLFPPP
jgi:Sigma-70, region 4